jgi:hypothetical protein
MVDELSLNKAVNKYCLRVGNITHEKSVKL